MEYIRLLKEDYKNNKSVLTKLVQEKFALKKRNGLSTLYIYVTQKCNLNCLHCYVGKNGEDSVSIDLDAIKKVVLQCIELGVSKVKISGGEPIIFKNIYNLLDFLTEQKIEEIILETNGTLLNKINKENLLLFPHILVHTSLDHYIASKHDHFRNKKGSFKKTVEFIKFILLNNMVVQVTTVLYKENYKSILKTIQFINELGVKHHRVILNMHPMGNALMNIQNDLSIEECLEASYIVVNSEYYKRGHVSITLPPALLPYNSFLNFKSCGWGEEVIGILPSGKVTMCYGINNDNKLIGGDITHMTINEILSGDFFQNLYNIRENHVKGICGNCIFYSLCKGLCKLSSYAHYKELDGPYPFCQQLYDKGLFPAYAINDLSINSSYKKI